MAWVGRVVTEIITTCHGGLTEIGPQQHGGQGVHCVHGGGGRGTSTDGFVLKGEG